MQKNSAYSLFQKMINEAELECVNFTLSSEISVESKIDKSLVTACDQAIDRKLSSIAVDAGLQVVSEEGEHEREIVESGNYITIDPIDGTLGYLEYVNSALVSGDMKNFIKTDLGPTCDFCLLLGVVEEGVPCFGACFNFVTKELIMIDGEDKQSLIRENNRRNYVQKLVAYVDQREGEEVERRLGLVPDISIIKQATLGLKSLYTVINPHDSAVTVHRVQSAGLWDIMPAAVAARAMGAEVLDDHGDPVEFRRYVLLPGRGATIIKGERFEFVKDLLKTIPNRFDIQ